MTGKLFAWLIFGLIGLAAFGYGKKQGRPKTMLIAVVLMGYPYLVSSPLALWLIGAGLTAALWVSRR
ncbi:MAG: hypothetical protein ABII00_09965 [Elusimicrobiota bacterium]